MAEKFKTLYTPLFGPELIQEIENTSTLRNFETGFTLIEYGEYVRSIPLLIKGSIKIIRQDHKGNELFLYFLHPGETCAMTLSCCMGRKKSGIKAVAETPVSLINIPVQKMEEWSGKYKTWRNFVFENYHNQLMSAFQVIDSIAFTKLDMRLIEYLKNRWKIAGSNSIKTTHQEIANDLNSSRVVISRLLKKLENKHKIQLNHNCIEIINL